MKIRDLRGVRMASLAGLFTIALAAVTIAQQPATRPSAPTPASPTPATVTPPAVAPAPASAQADTPQVKKDREWLVAYLIAHQGYRIDQMDALEKRIDRMSPTQVETLIDVYQQKHELALQREANYQRLQQQQFSMMQAQQAQRDHEQDVHTQELDQAANLEQSRLNTQAVQAGTPQTFPSSYAPFGYGYGYPAYGSYYDRYWH